MWLFTVGSALLLTSCADFFQGKVPMDTSKENLSSLYDLLTPPVKITSLDAPTELHVSQRLYAGKIEISWSAVPNATSYQLERAVVTGSNPDGTWTLPDESAFETIESFAYGTRYTDVILKDPKYSSVEPGWRFYYRVFAQNLLKGYDPSPYYPDYEEKKNPDGTTQVNADPSIYGCLFRATAQVEADKGKSTDSISVVWSAVPGAAKYLIYRGEKENGTDSVYIDEVLGSETSYTNAILPAEQGVEFYYKIYAENTNGERSPESSLAMGYSLVEGAPVAPENVWVDNGLGTSKSVLTVRWDEVAGSDTEKITYALYRTSSVDSTYKLLKKDLSSCEHKDTTAAPGLHYYYFVQVSSEKDDGTVLKSSFSESGKDSADPAYGFLLSPPASVEVCDSDKEGCVRIRWKPAVNVLGDAAPVSYSYNICTDSEYDGYFGTIAVAETEGEEDSEGFLFCDVAVAAGSDYFVVKTVNPSPSSSDKESKASTVVAPVPDAPETVYVTKTAGKDTFRKLIEETGGSFDESVWEPNKNTGVYPVLVTWSQSEKAAGYNVYRSTKPESGFKKINDSVIKDLYYIDVYSAAKSGTFYYYKVFPLNTLGQGTKSNDPAHDSTHDARGYGALTREQWFREYNKTVKSSQSKLTLMHKASDTDKLGSETVYGAISGSLSYKAAIAGLGAEITMHYENFADKFISDDSALGIKFVVQGNTDTSSNMSANGKMHGTVQCYTKEIDVTDDASVGNTFEKMSAEEKDAITKTGDKHYLCGMYPGKAVYDNLQIKGGAAGGGYYGVETYELDYTSDSEGTVVLEMGAVDWLVGEE